MSNFSTLYQWYLGGYCGDLLEHDGKTTERLYQAAALGVYHRTTSKPPLMSSVAVRAVLRRLYEFPEHRQWTTLVLTGGVSPHTKIPIIRVIREITGLGLREAKDITDSVEKGVSWTLHGCYAGKDHNGYLLNPGVLSLPNPTDSWPPPCFFVTQAASSRCRDGYSNRS